MIRNFDIKTYTLLILVLLTKNKNFSVLVSKLKKVIFSDKIKIYSNNTNKNPGGSKCHQQKHM